MGKRTVLQMVATESKLEMPPEKWAEAKSILLNLMLQNDRERHKNDSASPEVKIRSTAPVDPDRIGGTCA